MSVFTLAHLSDLHATPVKVRHPAEFFNKRMLGFLSWSIRRRREYRPEILAALVDDLRAHAPDHVVITGDLTNLGLEDEYVDSLAWLRQLGGPQRVSLIPGNHDTYTSKSETLPWSYWMDYMRSDASVGLPSAMHPAEFPTVRIYGRVAIVGVSTARATAPFLASGAVGQIQLQRIEELLGQLTDTSLCRIVLIHHPPDESIASARRRLTDAAAFRRVLVKTGAELILHGHTHRTVTTTIPGPHGSIPVVGVRAASAVGRRPQRRASYHLYRIEPDTPGAERPRFRIAVTMRVYSPIDRGFRSMAERSL